MSDQYAENKLKLLGILYGLYSGENQTPSDGPPFTVESDGTVVLNQDLVQILKNNHHSDFAMWTKQNIANLT